MTDTTGMIKPLRFLCFCVATGLLALSATGAIAQADEALTRTGTGVGAEAEAEAEAGIRADASAGEEMTLRPDRLWLPANRRNLQPLLMAAAQQALENPECADVLYGRLNEYRTERTEPTFSILCLHDARTTFNLLYLASELEAGENARSADSGQPLSAELERLRRLLQEPLVPSAGASGQTTPATDPDRINNESPHVPVPAVTTPPEIF